MKVPKRVPAIFFRTASGNEPVREWLKSLAMEDRKAIGDDIRRVEFGWPIGMPLTRSLGDGLHEVRTKLTSNRIARVLFFVSDAQELVLLNGFVKKTKKTPDREIALARRNKRLFEKAG